MNNTICRLFNKKEVTIGDVITYAGIGLFTAYILIMGVFFYCLAPSLNQIVGSQKMRG